jgi:hypothetical protein
MKNSPDLPAPPDTPIVEGREEYEVNSCSGHPEWHFPQCNGDCGTDWVKASAVEIRNELNAWVRLGADPTMIPHNVFNIDAQLYTCIRVIIEMLGVDEEEFNERYRQNLLEKLKTSRTENEANFRKMRAMQNIAIPGGGIIGPNGEVIH